MGVVTDSVTAGAWTASHDPGPWLLVVADHVWTLEEVVGLLETTEE